MPLSLFVRQSMRNTSQGQEIRVGIVTLLSIVALVAGIVWGKGIGFGKENKTVQMRFANASGIDVGAPVTFNGVRKGNVTGLKVEPNGVVMTALVESDVPLKSDAVAAIEMAELTGGKRIALEGGTASAPLPDGATIEGVIRGDANQIIADAGELTQQAKRLMVQLDTALMAVNSILGDRRLRNSITSSVENLDLASSELRSLAQSSRPQVERLLRLLDATAADVRALVAGIRPTAERTLASADAAVGDVRRISATAERAIVRADSLVAKLDSLMVDIREGEGTVSRLLYDKKLADQLQGTIISARQLIEEFRRNGVKIKVGF